MNFIYFLGRFHVLAVHLPIGILMLAAVLEILAHTNRFRGIAPALPIVWLAGAISAAGTIALGYMHASEGGFEGPALNWHRWMATGTAVFAFAVWAARAEFPRIYARAWPAAAAGVLILLTLTGHFGGELTHGKTYLTQYAPAPLKRLAGIQDELDRPKVTDIAEADIYLDVVGPAFRQRCTGCHNEAKRRGGLSLASYDGVMKGGDDGVVIAAGDPDGSDLMRRIVLPPDDLNAMPKDGKTPLSPAQIEAIRWWISIGAPHEGAVGALSAPQPVQAAIGQALGLPQSASSAPASPETAG